jgi:hypothetical protein
MLHVIHDETPEGKAAFVDANLSAARARFACGQSPDGAACANPPYRRRCRDRREPYNDFRSLFAAGHHRDRPFDGSEKRLTGISDLPGRRYSLSPTR